MEYIDHNLIVDNKVEYREYQDYLSSEGLKDSSLIVLPTGTGKTIVSLQISAERLLNNSRGTCLLLAPTKPLVEQHYNTYSELLDIMDDQIVQFTGEVSPSEREEIWNNSPSIVIATPQVIENDLISDRINLIDVVHITFDECHRATGDYSYVYIADKYVQQSNNQLITGLSASPGDDKEQILNICDNINVKSVNIITEDDERIQPYVYDTTIETRFIDVDDEILDIRDTIQDVYKDRLKKLYDDDFIDSRSKTVSQRKLNNARGNIQNEMQKGNSDAYQAMSVWAECMKLNRAIELIETQGVNAFMQYYQRLEDELKKEDSSKAVERLISDSKMRKAIDNARKYDGNHDKYDALRSELVRTSKINDGKSLVFTKSRDTVESLIEKLSDDFDIGRLVGQTDKKNSEGMTQAQQKEAVDKFSNDEFEVLVSTEIGEEGLDISEVDTVVFYEPASKGIEQVQRQGRTGRSQMGRVVILIGEGTRDVGMYFKSKDSVENMKTDVDELKNINNLQDEIEEELVDKQKTLSESFEDKEDIETEINETEVNEDIDKVSINQENNKKPVVIADSRESKSTVVKNLDRNEDIDLKVKNNMEVGDYIVGNECAIERKSAQDLHDTITGDRSVFEQIKNMSNSYDRPVLLIEGGHGELYTKNIHPNSIRGILASLVSDFNCTIIESVDEEDSAEIIRSLAEKEQDDTESTVNPHGNKDTQTVSSQQEYIVSSIDTIGPKTAKKLLNDFGSIHNIFTANKDDLKNVSGIGDSTANKIYSIIRQEYSND